MPSAGVSLTLRDPLNPDPAAARLASHARASRVRSDSFGVVPHLGGTSVLREFYVGWVTRALSFEHVTGRLLSLTHTLIHLVILARRGRGGRVARDSLVREPPWWSHEHSPLARRLHPRPPLLLPCI